MTRSAKQRSYFTAEEYLGWERAADVKSEYYDAEIVMMAGGSPAHSRIANSVGRHLGNALDGSSCGVFNSDLKVRSSAMQFVYPDVTVVCGELEFHDVLQDVVTNPRLIVEVLSPSTEHQGRHVKWLRYQQITALTDYLLVWQDELVVEHFSRSADADWRYVAYLGLDAELVVSSLDCHIPLRRIYDGIDFSLSE